MSENFSQDIQAMKLKTRALARELEARIIEFKKETGIPVIVQIGEPESTSIGQPLTQQVRVVIFVD